MERHAIGDPQVSAVREAWQEPIGLLPIRIAADAEKSQYGAKRDGNGRNVLPRLTRLSAIHWGAPFFES